MKKGNSKEFATKSDVEAVVGGLAYMTAKEFSVVHKKIDIVDEKVDALNEKVDTGFTELRKEMHDGFRMIIAAIESVEYTKLKMRIDVLEDDMARMKSKVKI